MSSMTKAWLLCSFYLALCMSPAFLIRQNHSRQTLEEICESASFLSFPSKALRSAPSSTPPRVCSPLRVAGLAWEDKFPSRLLVAEDAMPACFQTLPLSFSLNRSKIYMT